MPKAKLVFSFILHHFLQSVNTVFSWFSAAAPQKNRAKACASVLFLQIRFSLEKSAVDGLFRRLYHNIRTQLQSQCAAVQTEVIIVLVVPVSAGIDAVEGLTALVDLAQHCLYPAFVYVILLHGTF